MQYEQWKTCLNWSMNVWSLVTHPEEACGDGQGGEAVGEGDVVDEAADLWGHEHEQRDGSLEGDK